MISSNIFQVDPWLWGALMAPMVSAILAVAIHESGHLLAALLLGARVSAIHIGTGPKWCSFRLGKLQVNCGVLLFAGYVVAQPVSSAWKRWAYGIFVAAGPLATFAATWFFYQLWRSQEADFSLQEIDAKAICLGAPLLMNAIYAISFFRTSKAELDGRLFSPDLVLLLSCLFDSREHWEADIHGHAGIRGADAERL
ncbi:MAG: site-2 protease family protein [Chthoniobacteraceae bacterium]